MLLHTVSFHHNHRLRHLACIYPSNHLYLGTTTPISTATTLHLFKPYPYTTIYICPMSSPGWPNHHQFPPCCSLAACTIMILDWRSDRAASVAIDRPPTATSSHRNSQAAAQLVQSTPAAQSTESRCESRQYSTPRLSAW